MFNGIWFCSSRWRQVTILLETVKKTNSNILLLISLTLLRKTCHELLPGEMELVEGKAIAGAGEEDGWRMEVMIVLRNGRCEGEKSSHGWEASENSSLHDVWSRPCGPGLLSCVFFWTIVELSIYPVRDHTDCLHKCQNMLKSVNLSVNSCFLQILYEIWVKCYETQALNTNFLSLNIFCSTWDYFTVQEQLIAPSHNQLRKIKTVLLFANYANSQR